MRCPALDQLPPPPDGKTGWPWTEESQQLPDTMPNGEPWLRISIVTPSYNQGQYIEETIRSVLLQGYPDLEYIIIDGGSSDNTLDIVHTYSPWLSYWVSEPDGGQTHAINKGWMHATGEILAYINSDDCYLAGAIGSIAQELRANPHAGMIYGTAAVVDEAGKALRSWEAHPFDLRVMLRAGNLVPQTATFFSHDALNYVGYLNEEWHMIMDYEFCIRIGLQFPSICIPRTLAKFRDHAQSKTRKRFEMTASELLQFVNTFYTDQMSSQELQAIKRATASRVHYELAMAYLAQMQREERKALVQIRKSILLDPLFALRRPVHTAYLMKEVILGYLQRAMRSRLHAN